MKLIHPNELITPEQVATELQVKTGTLAAWRNLGRGPKFLKVGRRIMYCRDDLAAWLGTRQRQPGTPQSSPAPRTVKSRRRASA